MWNFQSLTHQLGDAFEKVKKEVESFGVYENEQEANLSATETPAIDDGIGAVFVPTETKQSPKVKDRTRHVDRDVINESPRPETVNLPQPVSESPGPAVLVNEELRTEDQIDAVSVEFIVVEVDPAEETISTGKAVQLKLNVSKNRVQETDGKKGHPEQNDSAVSIEALQNLLLVREQQLQTQSQKLLQLQERNECLEGSALSISQVAHDTMRRQYEERLSNAESQIYALSKERDALLHRVSGHSDKDKLIREKEEIIEEVMAEGQKLSKKQLELENAIRKKGARIREMESENEGLKEKLTAEISKSEQLLFEKAQLVQSMQESEAQQKQQLEVQRVQFENRLADASAAQAQADLAAKEAAREGLLSRVQDAEEKNEMLEASVAALHSEVEMQKSKAEAAESRFKQEVAALEERCHEAEMKHEELLEKFPEATKPLLHQLESLQADMDSNAEAWALAERSLIEQLETAEESLRSAQLKEQTMLIRIEELNAKLADLEMEYQSCKEENSRVTMHAEELAIEFNEAKKRAEESALLVAKHAEETEKLKMTQQSVLERMQEDLSTERVAKLSAETQLRQLQLTYQKQKADLEDLRMQTNMSDAKLDRARSTMDDVSVVSEATDREGDATSAKSFSTSRQYQFERLQKQVQSLEKIKEHLSAELVSASQRAQRAESSLSDFDKVKQELSAFQTRYASAIELLGEREEQVEELKADLEDFKQMYRDQISYVAEQLSGPRPST